MFGIQYSKIDSLATNCSEVLIFCPFVQKREAKLDPITDIFSAMHVTAFGLHRLEATAPWGLIQKNRPKKKSRPPAKRSHPQIWRTSPCFRAVTAGSVSKAFRSRFPSPVATASCWPATLQSSCAIAREHVQGQPSARSPLKPTAMSLIMEVVAHRRQSSVGPSVSIAPA